MTAIALNTPIARYERVQTRGASDESSFIAEMMRSLQEKQRESVYFDAGVSQSLSELQLIQAECRRAGWDGYDALPISPMSAHWAQSFLEELPLGLKAPSISADPDGQISFEWYQSPKKILSISVDPDGSLHYATIQGARKEYGSEPYSGFLPRKILGLIRSIVS